MLRAILHSAKRLNFAQWLSSGLLAWLLTLSGTPFNQVIGQASSPEAWKPFQEIKTGIPGVRNGKVAWGDYDKDGRPDLMITGKTGDGKPLTRLYHNTTGGFVDVSGQLLPDVNLFQVSDGMVAWGDYDNDSWPDVVVTGDLGGGPHNYNLRLYHNNPNQAFDNATVKLWEPFNPLLPDPPMVYGTAHWIDFFHTGRLDIFIMGQVVNNTITGADLEPWRGFYTNDSKGGFERLGDPFKYNDMPYLRYCASDFADFDKDGNLDVIVIGEEHVTNTFSNGSLVLHTNLYRGTPNPNASQIHDVTTRLPTTPGLKNGSVAWGDYDADTWPDLVITGQDASGNYHTYVYHNNAGKSFTDVSAQLPGLPSLAFSSVAWGDFDNDGRMDLMLTGSRPGQTEPISKLYHSSPSGFIDASYLLPDLVNVDHSSIAWVDYDNDGNKDLLLTGNYSDAGPFTQLYRNQGAYTRFEAISRVLPDLPGVANSSVVWADYDNDGRLDLMVSGNVPGKFAANPALKLYHNTASGFEDKSSLLPGLHALGYSSTAWGDYDNDGRLDLMVTGSMNAITAGSRLYHNTGNGFEDKSSLIPGLPNVAIGSVAWGDYDNDGRADLLLTGSPSLGGGRQVSKLYHNTATGFVEATNLLPGLPGLEYSSVAWGDYNSDGKLDLMVTGRATAPFSKLYRNTGSGFEDASGSVPGLPGLAHGSVAWGDYDNDGWLDLLLTGAMDEAQHGTTKLYHNTGSGFVDATAKLPDVPPVAFSSVAFGDYDNDGKLDVLLTGSHTDSEAATRLYHNTGEGFESVSDLDFPDLQDGSLAWGDYDNDGKLDLIMTGISSAGGFTSKLYRNLGATVNTPPAAPADLNSRPLDKAVQLVWSPASDAQTPQPGLNYNLYIGDTPGGRSVLGPMSDQSTGYRRVVRLGNSQAPTFLLNGLTPGKTYYWSVQAIDGAFAGSPFAPEHSFTTGSLLDNDARQPLQLLAPLYNCQTGTFAFRTTGGDNNLIEYMAPGITAWTTNPRQWVDQGLRQAADAQPITLVARQSGQVVRYVFDLRALCPVGDPNQFRQVAPLYDCQSGAFTFQTTGGDGSPIEYRAPGITAWSSNPNQFVDQGLRTAADAQPLTLVARQGNQEVRYVWDIRAVCPADVNYSGARQGGAPEPGVGLRVQVYPNPVESELTVRMEGVQNQPVGLRLTNLHGQVVLERTVEDNQSAHQERLPLAGLPSGVYLLQVSTPQQHVTLKVIKR